MRVLLSALVLLAPALAPAATRVLALPVVAEGVDAPVVAAVQAALDAALADLPEVERVPAPGPTFCASSDPRCIADAGARASAEEVLHVSARPVGDTVSLLFVLVTTRGAAVRKVPEVLRPGQAAALPVRAAVVRLVAPGRYVGSLEVRASPGSEIWVDGQRVATAPAPPLDHLSPGQHLVRVVGPDGGEDRAYVDVRFGEVTRFPPVAHGESALRPGGTSGTLRTLRVVLLAAGGGALVGGIVAHASAQSARGDRDRLTAGPVTDPARVEELASTYDERRALSAGLLVGSAALLTGSGVLFALDLFPGEGAGAGLAMRAAW